MLNVIGARGLSKEILASLCHRELDIVRMTEILDTKEYVAALHDVLHSGLVGYVRGKEVELHWLGHSVFDSCRSGLADTDHINRVLVSLFAPLKSPISILREQLSKCVDGPFRNLEYRDQASCTALFRHMNGKGESLPHQDDIRWISGPSGIPPDVRNQLAMVLYLNVPAQGGELCFWDKALSIEEYQRCRRQGSFGIEWSSAGSYDAELSPTSGEVILFDSTRLHAVRRFIGARTTFNCFVGINESLDGLSVWA
jgi:hypothetical protein